MVFFGKGASPARANSNYLSSKFDCHVPEQGFGVWDGCRLIARCRSKDLETALTKCLSEQKQRGGAFSVKGLLDEFS